MMLENMLVKCSTPIYFWWKYKWVLHIFKITWPYLLKIYLAYPLTYKIYFKNFMLRNIFWMYTENSTNNFYRENCVANQTCMILHIYSENTLIFVSVLIFFPFSLALNVTLESPVGFLTHLLIKSSLFTFCHKKFQYSNENILSYVIIETLICFDFKFFPAPSWNLLKLEGW